MMIKKIYFDMDGVLADFDRGVRELCNMEPLKQAEDNPEEYVNELWSRIRAVEHFYDRLEFVQGAKEMFESIYSRYGDKCEILTGIPKPRRGITTAGEDKINWVRRLLSEDIVINVVLREEKIDFCTGKDCILIDDYEVNIREWENSGGTGIMFSDSASVIDTIADTPLGYK
jgi:5'' nucleotidase, deoxy (Pyrimidine), cytosolic type C protein (NT5C).